jgi:hypothetical protein
MKIDFIMILSLVILQGAPGLGATKIAYRTKKKVYVAFTAHEVRKRGPSSTDSFLTASARENERVLEIHDEPIPEETSSRSR